MILMYDIWYSYIDLVIGIYDLSTRMREHVIFSPGSSSSTRPREVTEAKVEVSSWKEELKKNVPRREPLRFGSDFASFCLILPCISRVFSCFQLFSLAKIGAARADETAGPAERAPG